MSKYNLIRGEAFIRDECVSIIEHSGFTNVEQVIAKVLMSMHDEVPHPSKVQIKIANLDKGQIQLYQRVLE
jgi:GTPase Era involved in 16S rRNA processing